MYLLLNVTLVSNDMFCITIQLLYVWSSSGVDRTIERHFSCKNTPLPTSIVFLPPYVDLSTEQKRHSLRIQLIVSYVKFSTGNSMLWTKNRSDSMTIIVVDAFKASRMIFGVSIYSKYPWLNKNYIRSCTTSRSFLRVGVRRCTQPVVQKYRGTVWPSNWLCILSWTLSCIGP